MAYAFFFYLLQDLVFSCSLVERAHCKSRMLCLHVHVCRTVHVDNYYMARSRGKS